MKQEPFSLLQLTAASTSSNMIMNGMTHAIRLGLKHITTRQMVVGSNVQASIQGNTEMGSELPVPILALSMVCKSAKVEVYFILTDRNLRSDQLFSSR